ncbi:MAG: hypothetical protein J6P61_08095 [Erysipelotrichaceae bacterium]|nr:hypothetical protein [Erysipelotrichaceae bacterium]
MNQYQIRDYLKKGTFEQCLKDDLQFVIIMSFEEWQQYGELFHYSLEFDWDPTKIHHTKAESNYDAITGTFSIPNRENITGPDNRFAFVMDHRGIVFVDDTGKALQYAKGLRHNKKWHLPSLERFFYDFLVAVIADDYNLLMSYERELEDIEKKLLDNHVINLKRVNEIRSDMRDLRDHYEQLIDMCEELEENEIEIFAEENLRFFHMYSNKVNRLYDSAAAVREYTVQIRELYQSQLDVKQNHIMSILTIVTTIFMPLTLIAGWYGMNFKYMPELESPYGYPVVIIVSVLIIIGSLIYCKIKKWL